MKALKCILAVALGTVLGLLSSCGPKAQPADQRETPDAKKATEVPQEGKQQEPPKKQEDLPVRGPMYE